MRVRRRTGKWKDTKRRARYWVRVGERLPMPEYAKVPPGRRGWMKTQSHDHLRSTMVVRKSVDDRTSAVSTRHPASGPQKFHRSTHPPMNERKLISHHQARTPDGHRPNLVAGLSGSAGSNPPTK